MDSRPARRGSKVAPLALFAPALLACLLVVSVALASSPVDRPADRSKDGTESANWPSMPGEIIVGFEPHVSEAEQDSVLARVSGTKKQRFGRIHGALVAVDTSGVEEAIQRLEDDPRVRYAEPNFRLFADTHGTSPNDPSFHELWALDNFGQTVDGAAGVPDADIDAVEAWGVATGSASVVVSVIDTGVDFGHADLGGSMESSPLMWVNPGENCPGCRTNGVDDDANGYVDDWRGWDFVNNDNSPIDDNGHGTHVAGTIGALGNNGVGVAGVNWSVSVMALKFLNSGGSGSTADAVEAVLYASAKGAHVMNNSWGGGGFSQALLDAIKQADASGSLFVAAAGNSNANTDSIANYPSAYDAPNIVAVAATDGSDQKASFSSYGQRTVDLGAPGVNVYSTYPGNSYRYLDGTSMATPHVAGAAALAKAVFPGASDLGLKALLLRTVDPNASLSGRSATGGRLNVNAAVRCSAPKVWVEAPSPGFTATVGEAMPVRVIGASCASPSGVTVAAEANGSPIALTARGDGLYTGTYTPTAVGSLTITASASAGGATDTYVVSGSAVENYVCEDAPFAWIDATAGGTNTGITADDTSVTVSLPFAFNFYGQSFTSAKISSNGFLVFGSGTASEYLNAAIPSGSSPNSLVAPFWDDLNPAAGGSVWYRTIGSAPTRRFVVAWIGVPHYSNIGSTTLEVVLEEGTNDILFQYQDVNLASAAYDYGASATVGVEKDGSLGKQFSYNQPALEAYQNAKAIRFTTPQSAPDGPVVTTASLDDGTVGLGYSESLQASGGTMPYSWNVVAGALPTGLSLGSGTGAISGMPTGAGAWVFTVAVTDSSTPALSSTRQLSIEVATPPSITTASLPDGTTGQLYSQTLQASGGATPYAWSVVAGSLPPGLSLNASTGTIAGTPTSAGSWTFTTRVTDGGTPARTADRGLGITVVQAPVPLAITTSRLPDGKAGQAYAATLQASGGTAPYAWSIASGTLPPGLSLSASTGTITGTPTKPGTFKFTVRATDGGAPAQTATRSLAIKIWR